MITLPGPTQRLLDSASSVLKFFFDDDESKAMVLANAAGHHWQGLGAKVFADEDYDNSPFQCLHTGYCCGFIALRRGTNYCSRMVQEGSARVLAQGGRWLRDQPLQLRRCGAAGANAVLRCCGYTAFEVVTG